MQSTTSSTKTSNNYNWWKYLFYLCLLPTSTPRTLYILVMLNMLSILESPSEFPSSFSKKIINSKQKSKLQFSVSFLWSYIYTAFPWSDRKSKVFTKKTEKLWTPKIVENSTNYGIHLSRIVIILRFLPEYPQKNDVYPIRRARCSIN